MPSLDRAGVYDRKVNLAECFEFRIVVSNHMHDLAALIQDLSQRLDHNPVDHRCPPLVSPKTPNTTRSSSPGPLPVQSEGASLRSPALCRHPDTDAGSHAGLLNGYPGSSRPCRPASK